MEKKGANRPAVLDAIEHRGGLRPGVADEVSRETGVPAADVYGVGTFYHLLADPTKVRVCTGLSCKLAGADERLAALQADGVDAVGASCLGRCDCPPAVWDPANVTPTPIPGLTPASDELAINLAGSEHASYAALALAREKGPDWVCEQIEAAGLQGRGGAGFPAFIKWNAVRKMEDTPHHVVLNADEGEPGTFKDRECMLRRPHLVIEGLAIAALTLGATQIHLYVRGEFGKSRASLEGAIAEARERGCLDGSLEWVFVDGHGAYICGEETALLEAIEGKRGMPRLKPPFPVEKGLFDKPTLIQNVETICCVPAILSRGGEWFKALGKTEPGSKLYCMSGHVAKPGVYELPLGVSFDELLEAAGGCVGTLKAFSPGGASSGFLPASKSGVAMAFKSLQAEGAMLGSAGVVVLNDTVDMCEAALMQAVFFEDESCGQCAPCRIGTQIIRQSLEKYRAGDADALHHLQEVAWGMGEASICGLGQAASWPLTSAMKYWPEAFGLPTEGA